MDFEVKCVKYVIIKFLRVKRPSKIYFITNRRRMSRAMRKTIKSRKTRVFSLAVLDGLTI